MSRPPVWVVLAVAGASALVVGAAADRLALPPIADVARGTEDVFAQGLQAREIPPRQGPQRWTTDRAVFTFKYLPPGSGVLEVAVHGQREPVTVVSEGVILGQVPRGGGPLRVALPEGRRTRQVELLVPTFVAGDGRRLGALLGHVRVETAGAGGAAVLLLFLAPGLAVAGCALVSRVPGPGCAALALGVNLAQWAAVTPGGALRSGYALYLAVALSLAACVLALLARVLEKRLPGMAPWAFGALLLAFVVQGVAGTSPLMLVSDAMFHANKLVEVARGQFYPLSETQHAQPFRIPYGVAFYVLLAPLARAGVDAVTLVRVGTAAAGLAASLALLLLLGRTPRLAGAAVIALQILPGTFDTAYSHGNFSNAFGQAATVAFFAWWAGRASGGFVLGALALLLAGLAHLSSLVVLCALAPALAMARLRAGQGLDRQRLLAIGVALLAIVAYYLHFWDLVLSQLPRLLEGGGQGRGASRSAWDAAWLQVQGALAVWGPPAIALAVAGWPGPGRSDEPTLDRDLRAFWLAGAVLVIPAVVSPLEVRYLYALTVPVAVAAAVGFYRLHDGGHVARAVAWVLLALQAALFGRTVAEAVLWRYGKLLPAIAFCGGVPPDTGC